MYPTALIFGAYEEMAADVPVYEYACNMEKAAVKELEKLLEA